MIYREVSDNPFLENYTPCWGYWLADVDDKFADAYFDITDSNSYPIELTTKEHIEINNIISRLHRENHTVKVVRVQEDEPILHDIKKIMRNRYYKTHPQKITFSESVHNYTGKALSKKELQKRLFFLYIAKLVVAGTDSVSNIAHRFNLSKINVSIWTAIYLSKGEDAFFLPVPKSDRDREYRIYNSYVIGKCPVHIACANDLVFSYNGFKNIMRRARRLFDSNANS